MAAPSVTEPATQLVQKIGQEGTFAVGVLLGCVVSIVVQWSAAGERKEYARLMTEREKELNKQLQLRDDRINKLHDELGKLRGVKPMAKG
jgi:hypothetical protein